MSVTRAILQGLPSVKRALVARFGRLSRGGRSFADACWGSRLCSGIHPRGRGRWGGLKPALRSAIQVPLLLLPVAVLGGEDAEKLQRLESGVGTDSLVQLLVGLLLVLAVIGVSAWLLRRFSPWSSTADGALKVVAALPVGQRERVMVIQVGEEQLLIGVSPGQVEMLHVLEQPLPYSPAPRQPTSGFARQLASAVERRRRRS